MRIVVTGSSGLVGTALSAALVEGRHEVTRLVRHDPPGTDEALWDPAAGTIDTDPIAGADAVVHLAGASIAGGRWTAARKALLRSSRLDGTRLVAATMASLDGGPKVLISASAVGFYGDRGDEVMTEESTGGSGFLAELCQEWEAATAPASDAGVRVVNLRIGVVLAADGGALDKMLTPFKLGVGGRLGSGRQYLSWIALDDLVAAIIHALTSDELSGPVNAVAPQPVTNLEFTKALGRALGRPTILPMPAFAARLAFGEMADEALLASTRATPARLEASGFRFRLAAVDAALMHVLA